MPQDLKGEMKKLREKAYQKSMKKKGVRKFGEDEYFIPVKLPGMKYGGKVMPKQKPKDFYEGEGYKGSPDMYPDYEEDKKDIKQGKEPQHMGKKYGGVMKKKMGGLTGGQRKLDINKDGKISGEDFKLLKGKKNKMKGGGIAIKGTGFKGVF